MSSHKLNPEGGSISATTHRRDNATHFGVAFMYVFFTTGIRIASSLLPAVSAKESAFADQIDILMQFTTISSDASDILPLFFTATRFCFMEISLVDVMNA